MTHLEHFHVSVYSTNTKIQTTQEKSRDVFDQNKNIPEANK